MTQDIAGLCERLRSSAEACDAPTYGEHYYCPDGDELREAASTIERLQAELKQAQTIIALEARATQHLAASQDRVAKLEEALKPFVEDAPRDDPSYLDSGDYLSHYTWGDLRRARNALEQKA